MSDEEQKKIPIVMSPAFLAPVEEKDHYGLFRSVLVRREDGDQVAGPPLGPLMIFRKCASDEKEEMWTFDPISKERVSLIKVWDAREKKPL